MHRFKGKQIRKPTSVAVWFFSEALGDFNLKATAGLPPEKQKAGCVTKMACLFPCLYIYIYRIISI